MQRLNHYLSGPQHEKLRRLSATTGLSIAEHVRRALDDYLLERAYGEEPADETPQERRRLEREAITA